jgi:hypothetical protein
MLKLDLDIFLEYLTHLRKKKRKEKERKKEKNYANTGY